MNDRHQEVQASTTGSELTLGSAGEVGYERPTVMDHGSLAELTLSGSVALSDSFGATSGGS